MSQALILGGTKGLGQAWVGQCRDHDIYPVITGRSVVNEVGESGAHIRLDLCQEESISQAFQDVIALSGLFNGDLRYIFWVAGAGFQGRLADQTPQQIRDMYQLTDIDPSIFFSQLLRERHCFDSHYMLVTVSLSSAWRIRSNETVYGGAKSTPS